MCPQAIKLKERSEENVRFTPESGHKIALFDCGCSHSLALASTAASCGPIAGNVGGSATWKREPLALASVS